MNAWLDFWNHSDNSLYVNERHRQVHFQRIAEDIVRLVPDPQSVVLDFGPGEALAADIVAARCQILILCEAADEIRLRLAARYAGEPRIRVIAPAALDAIFDGSVDFIIINSVLQYLTPADLDGVLGTARRLIKPDGRLVIADVIPPESGAVSDISALLRFGWRDGFFLAAVGGLAATFFSPYRKLRGQLGLARHSEAELLGRLRNAGFTAERLRPNLGHNQNRLAFIAGPAGSAPAVTPDGAR